MGRVFLDRWGRGMRAKGELIVSAVQFSCRDAQPAGPKCCECLLRALVAVEAVGLQAIATTAGERIDQREPQAVAAVEPRVCP